MKRILSILAASLLLSIPGCEGDGTAAASGWKTTAGGYQVQWEDHGMILTGFRTESDLFRLSDGEVFRVALDLYNTKAIPYQDVLDAAKTVKWYLVDDISHHPEHPGAKAVAYFNSVGPMVSLSGVQHIVNQWPWTVHQDPYTDLWFCGIESPQPYPGVKAILVSLLSL